MKKRILLVVASFILLAITSVFITEKKSNNICSEIAKIKILPFKGEHINDKVYNKIIANKESSIRCLLDNILNVTPMKDPRQAPLYSGYVVGDTAFFLIINLENLKFSDVLPANVLKKFKKQGIYAYFEYVESFKNRQQLYQKIKAIIENKNNGIRVSLININKR